MVTREVWTGGLLRFPRFLRLLAERIDSEAKAGRAEMKSLLYEEMRMRDIVVGVLVGVVLFAVRYYGERVVWPRVFWRYGRRTQKKLAENLYYWVYYSLAFGYFMTYVWPAAEWRVNLLDGGENVVRGLLDPYPPRMTEAEKGYYVQAWGFYGSAAVFLLLLDTRRSDFWEHVLHHAVTLGMVGMSYSYGYVRAGMLILGLHDVGDVFLYLAKFVHYLGYKGWDTLVFAAFAVTFYVTRLLMFARMVHVIGVETLQEVIEDPTFNEWLKYWDTYLAHWLFFVICLGTLLVLHCFWFSLILKMIYREVFLGSKVSDAGDIRSDDEDDDGEEYPSPEEQNLDDGFNDLDEIQKPKSQ